MTESDLLGQQKETSETRQAQRFNAKNPLEVSQLFAELKALLDMHFSGDMYVRGELTDLSIPNSGHWYFSIKDEKARLSCVMFKHANTRLGFRPKEGDKIILCAKAAFYEGQGRFQMIASKLIADGEGDLLRKYEELKQKLDREGVFNSDRKKAIPSFVCRLCVISSETGAAVHDVMRVLERRMPCMNVSLIPVQVQGDEAAIKIISAIEQANRLNYFDAILLTRGGGSTEDLWCFNDERLVRAVAASQIPLVSAIGHEIDVTLCDFAADKRSATPSSAAEELSIDSDAYLEALAYSKKKMRTKLTERVESLQQQGDLLQGRLTRANPLRVFSKILIQADVDIRKAMQNFMQKWRRDLSLLAHRMKAGNPRVQINFEIQKLDSTAKNLRESLTGRIDRHLAILDKNERLLQSMNPLKVLSRGYALALDNQGKALKDASEVSPGDAVSIRLAQGRLDTEVKHVSAKSESHAAQKSQAALFDKRDNQSE